MAYAKGFKDEKKGAHWGEVRGMRRCLEA